MNTQDRSQSTNQDHYDGKTLAKDLVVKDLVGAEDWKKSKTGYLTGFSVAKRSISTIFSTASTSVGNVGRLWSTLLSSENVPELPDGGGPRERFEASMQLHGRTESDLRVIIENTWKSSMLYAAVSAVGFLLISSSFLYVGYDKPLDGLIRFAPLFVTVPMLIKHAYTNWMVRNRKLDSLASYIRSGDMLPRRS